jgi:hypothetical protein
MRKPVRKNGQMPGRNAKKDLEDREARGRIQFPRGVEVKIMA